MHTLVLGRLASKILRCSGESGEEDHVQVQVQVRVLGVGEHLGELSLSKPQATIGRLNALEDCEILVIRRADFARLSRALP